MDQGPTALDPNGLLPLEIFNFNCVPATKSLTNRFLSVRILLPATPTSHVPFNKDIFVTLHPYILLNINYSGIWITILD